MIEDEEESFLCLPGMEDGMQETEVEERRFGCLEPWPSLRFCVTLRRSL